MSAILRKYGLAATVQGIPLVVRGAMDFKSNPTLASGDVKVSVDGGAFVNIEGAGTFSNYIDVFPAGGTSVRIRLDVTQMTSKMAVVQFIDTDVTKEWEDQEVVIESYGNASAQHAFDLGSSTVALAAGVQTGVIIPTTQSVTSAVLVDQTTSITTTTPGTVGGALHKADIQTGLMDLTQAISSSTPGTIGGAMHKADIQTGQLDLTQSISSITVGTVGGALHKSDTMTGQIDLTQTISSTTSGTIGGALHNADVDLDTTVSSRATNSGIATLTAALTPRQSMVNDLTPSTSSFITGLTEADTDYWKNALLVFTNGTLNGQGQTVTGYNGSNKRITTNPFTHAPANGDTFTLVPQGLVFSLALGGVWDSLRSAHTNLGTFGEAVASVVDKDGYHLDGDGLDVVTVEPGMNVRQAFAVIAAALGGQLTGAGTNSIQVQGANNPTQARINASVDTLGNRITVTLTLPA